MNAKKKELVGDYHNAGRVWRRAGDPVPVNSHDLCGQGPGDKDLGKALPYGSYDVAVNAGWVNVGTDHDTAAFAVESLRRWWNGAGREAYPEARRLLVTADSGGSNSYRTRAWKDGSSSQEILVTTIAATTTRTGLQVHAEPDTGRYPTASHHQ